MRVANVNEKAKVIKKSEVLVTCAPAKCINRQDQLIMAESYDVVQKGLLESVELNDKQRRTAEELITKFKYLVYFSV